ncbi:hypothetical protein EVAR_98974_1 [Eumeta japonica]|uniref:Uncharacterized protein n=1 Tax=Eumeta variegata TaxID=151549 RepID=A0A4C1YM70_EUMVA|nr:hypothetical protein EVAR_98974_1 [Eumeta japonica]
MDHAINHDPVRYPNLDPDPGVFSIPICPTLDSYHGPAFDSKLCFGGWAFERHRGRSISYGALSRRIAVSRPLAPKSRRALYQINKTAGRPANKSRTITSAPASFAIAGRPRRRRRAARAITSAGPRRPRRGIAVGPPRGRRDSHLRRCGHVTESRRSRLIDLPICAPRVLGRFVICSSGGPRGSAGVDDLPDSSRSVYLDTIRSVTCDMFKSEHDIPIYLRNISKHLSKAQSTYKAGDWRRRRRRRAAGGEGGPYRALAAASKSGHHISRISHKCAPIAPRARPTPRRARSLCCL